MLTVAGSLCLGAIFTFLILIRSGRNRRGASLPPGPPADPLIGHLRLLASRNPWELFHELSQKYGDVVHLDALGKPMIILSSEEAARELLEKRGPTHSDRPPFAFFFELGWKDLFIFLPYGERFQRQRRIAQQPFTNQRVVEYRDVQRREVSTLLTNLLESPTEFTHHIHMLNAAIMVDVTFGHRVESTDDRYLTKLVDVFSHYGSMAMNPSIIMLDYFPFLKHLPEWMPGAWYISVIKKARPIIKHAMEFPIAEVRKQMAEGVAAHSVISSHLELLASENQLTPEKIHELELAGQVIISGGVETTRSTLIVFVAAMALHPEAQKKAQQQIDSVVGGSRLPDFSDRGALPYIDAIVQEVMRWRPVGPTGVPHVSASDDEYRGMFIPKGATIFTNLWSMCLNEELYKDPHVFTPERFLPQPEGAGAPPSSNFIFGFGRRKCPGQNLAEATLWLTVAQILAVFDISKAKDTTGKDIDFDLKFVSTGLTIYPQVFPCAIHPRNAAAAALARESQHLAR